MWCGTGVPATSSSRLVEPGVPMAGDHGTVISLPPALRIDELSPESARAVKPPTNNSTSQCPGWAQRGPMLLATGWSLKAGKRHQVRLSPDYSEPSPLWPSVDETHALVSVDVLAKLITWQEVFDANFH
jgi:hypothetical protein